MTDFSEYFVHKMNMRTEINTYWPRGWQIFRKRCTARLERNETGFYGRCDFMVHPRDVDHYIERGLMEIRFKTEITGV